MDISEQKYIDAADNLFLALLDDNLKMCAYETAYLRMAKYLNFPVKAGVDGEMFNAPSLAIMDMAIILNLNNKLNPIQSIARDNAKNIKILRRYDRIISYLARDKTTLYMKFTPIICFIRMLLYFPISHEFDENEKLALDIVNRFIELNRKEEELKASALVNIINECIGFKIIKKR